MPQIKKIAFMSRNSALRGKGLYWHFQEGRGRERTPKAKLLKP